MLDTATIGRGSHVVRIAVTFLVTTSDLDSDERNIQGNAIALELAHDEQHLI